MKTSNLTYILLLIFSIVSCSSKQNINNVQTRQCVQKVDSTQIKLSDLQESLISFIENKNVNIGVAVIYNSKDTISVNGDRTYQMMSVFKFPLALAVAYQTDKNGGTLNDTIKVRAEELLEDTYSPMLKKYGKRNLDLTIQEVLNWALTESDNNAADILLKRIGGVKQLTVIMKEMGFPQDIKVGATEEDMHRDQNLSNLNISTPLAMASLFDKFNTEMSDKSPSFVKIASLLENCKTGSDRLAVPFVSTNHILGHKTGTGFSTAKGGVSALNDCGYVKLSNGKHYSIAVFIEDSPYNIEETSKIIADISQLVFDKLSIVS